jgi:hypothetical protein
VAIAAGAPIVAFVPRLTVPTRTSLEIFDLSDMPAPPQGGKNWLIEEKGIFILERGAGTLRTIACTHAGSGTIVAYDGVPDEDGEFPEGNKKAIGANGRLIYKANPPVMGSWMMDAGFVNGLTIESVGGQRATSTIMTVVWVGVRAANHPTKPIALKTVSAKA